MFRIFFLIAYFSCVQSSSCVQSCADHYWRDYNGSIPPDAIPAGHNNKTNCRSYIGQVYGHLNGLYVGTINPGSMEIIVACHGVVRSNVIIKILCAPDPSKYVWVPTTASTYKGDMEGEMPVVGGYDQTNSENTGVLGTLTIGRVFRDGRAIIGIIAAFWKADVWFYYPLKGKEIGETNYEVLVHRCVSSNIVL